MSVRDIEHAIFSIKSEQEFNDLALEIFHFQVNRNKVYREFIRYAGFLEKDINHYSNIPFIPIEFFKSHTLYCSGNAPDRIFESSGTTGTQKSRHAVADIGLYRKSFIHAFKRFYGDPFSYLFLALLPSYLEQGYSSLVYMADALIKESRFADSGFYLRQDEKLLTLLNRQDKPTLLLGVSFALLDMAESGKIKPGNKSLIVMETGGMKGRRREMVREELHDMLKAGFHVSSIHSEYGMTELLSQAYSSGNGRFKSPPWMKVLVRDTNDPKTLLQHNKTGGINIIDLANIYSCSFVATQDLGKTHDDGTFEVLGRFDHSDIRGCNLMVE